MSRFINVYGEWVPRPRGHPKHSYLLGPFMTRYEKATKAWAWWHINVCMRINFRSTPRGLERRRGIWRVIHWIQLKLICDPLDRWSHKRPL